MKRQFTVPASVESSPLPIAVYGLGAIGLEVARLVLTKRSLRLVAVIDTDPQKVGKDLSELLGLKQPTGLTVQPTADHAAAAGARVVIHSTQSFIPDVLDQLRSLAQAGLSVVSSTEELSFPWLRYEAQSRELDALAKDHGVRILGTGVNPGFVMDSLPLMVTGLAQQAGHIRLERVVDASKRRRNLQAKIGAGMTPGEFEAALDAGKMGHIGLVESVALIAAGLDWKLDRIEEEIDAVIAAEKLVSEHFTVEPGMVAGLKQYAIGYRGDEAVITLSLRMALGSKEPRDAGNLDAHPDLNWLVPGGVMGDAATAAVLVNTAVRVLETAPGLKTMLDIPLPRLLS